MTPETTPPLDLDAAATAALAARVVALLDGVPVGQALHVLKDEAPRLLCAGHVVDVTSPRFRAVAARAARG